MTKTFLNIYACASLSSTSNREVQMTKDGCSSVLHIPSVFHIYSKFSIHNTFPHSIPFPNKVRLIKVSRAQCVLAYQSRTRRPQMLVLRMPTVGRATLENRNLLTSTSGRLSCRFAIDCSLIKLKTSRYISELTDDNCLQ